MDYGNEWHLENGKLIVTNEQSYLAKLAQRITNHTLTTDPTGLHEKTLNAASRKMKLKKTHNVSHQKKENLILQGSKLDLFMTGGGHRTTVNRKREIIQDRRAT